MKSVRTHFAAVVMLALLASCGKGKFIGSGKVGTPPPEEKQVPRPEIAPKSQDVENEAKPISKVESNPPIQSPEVDPCSTSGVKSDVIQVIIPSNDGERCAWDSFGNSSMKSATLAARIERRFPINIPVNRRVCSISAESGNQTIRYDDQLFLTLNDHIVLSSSASVSRFFKAPNGFHIYDWSKIQGTSTGQNRFCADGVSCDLPKSDTTGNFNFQIENEASRRLFTSLQGQELFFGLVITGDNDPLSDCQLDTGMTLNIDYSYVD